MSPVLAVSVILTYFLALILISFKTEGKSDSEALILFSNELMFKLSGPMPSMGDMTPPST